MSFLNRIFKLFQRRPKSTLSTTITGNSVSNKKTSTVETAKTNTPLSPKFLGKERVTLSNGAIVTHEVYQSDSSNIAKSFLAGKIVSGGSWYVVVVKTPDGNWCKDSSNGLYFDRESKQIDPSSCSFCDNKDDLQFCNGYYYCPTCVTKLLLPLVKKATDHKRDDYWDKHFEGWAPRIKTCQHHGDISFSWIDNSYTTTMYEICETSNYLSVKLD